MLFLNDGDEQLNLHLHLKQMEPEEADHLQLCGKKSAEASQRAKLR
jgi:demethoxyubiquinone hydroxylase (CLK1/Coq7/Cat5 family)